MPDRYVLTLHTALASNTGGPFTATWDRVVVPATGTLRMVSAVARSLASNARTNSVDIFAQADAPAAGSNTATSVLVDPITLVNDLDSASGTIRESGARVAAGSMLELRTYADNVGSQPAFLGLTATIVIEAD